MPRKKKYVKKGGSGGSRPNPGKKSHIKRVRNTHRYIEAMKARYVEMPLERMLRVMNDPTIDDDERKDAMAFHAAPYCHARLQSVAITGGDGGPIQHALDLTKLTEDELVLLERMLAKGQVPLVKHEVEGVEVYTPVQNGQGDEAP